MLVGKKCCRLQQEMPQKAALLLSMGYHTNVIRIIWIHTTERMLMSESLGGLLMMRQTRRNPLEPWKEFCME